MITVKVLLLAERIIQDKQSNQMTLINMFEQFRPKGFPMLIPRFEIFALLERLESDGEDALCKAKITIGEKVLTDAPITIKFGNEILARLVFDFQGFVIPEPGDLRVTLSVSDIDTVSYTVKVFPADNSKPTVNQK